MFCQPFALVSGSFGIGFGDDDEFFPIVLSGYGVVAVCIGIDEGVEVSGGDSFSVLCFPVSGCGVPGVIFPE